MNFTLHWQLNSRLMGFWWQLISMESNKYSKRSHRHSMRTWRNAFYDLEMVAPHLVSDISYIQHVKSRNLYCLNIYRENNILHYKYIYLMMMQTYADRVVTQIAERSKH